MPVVHFAATLKTDVLTPIKTKIDSGGEAGSVELYTGTIPATPETAVVSQILLGTMLFPYPCGTVASGALTMGTMVQDNAADAAGVATWARVLNSAGVAVMDIDVTSLAGTGAIKLNNTTIALDGPIRCSSFVISVP